mmetsp:Transcript_25130/g.65853  ORF Transcript_25130/g.65853 Transcript_25130/m.65853 type:complete len:237 (-) Transcript_25130:133-843(-)
MAGEKFGVFLLGNEKVGGVSRGSLAAVFSRNRKTLENFPPLGLQRLDRLPHVFPCIGFRNRSIELENNALLCTPLPQLKNPLHMPSIPLPLRPPNPHIRLHHKRIARNRHHIHRPPVLLHPRLPHQRPIRHHTHHRKPHLLLARPHHRREMLRVHERLPAGEGDLREAGGAEEAEAAEGDGEGQEGGVGVGVEAVLAGVGAGAEEVVVGGANHGRGVEAADGAAKAVKEASEYGED